MRVTSLYFQLFYFSSLHSHSWWRRRKKKRLRNGGVTYLESKSKLMAKLEKSDLTLEVVHQFGDKTSHLTINL